MMMAEQGNGFSKVARTALLGYVAIISILLLSYSAHQYWRHQHYQTIAHALSPIIDTLESLQLKVVSNTANNLLLHDKVNELSTVIHQFIDMVDHKKLSVAGLDTVLSELERYQLQLQKLQDSDIHSRYALNAFAEQVRANTDEEINYYKVLLQRSRLYLNAPNSQYLFSLDEDVKRWQVRTQPDNNELFHYYQLYRQSLNQLVTQRYRLIADNKSVLLGYKKQWQQDSIRHLKDMQIAIFIWLVFGFTLGLVLLFYRNQELRKISQASLELARAKTDFLANMSHEIRTPMNAVLGFTSLLQHTPLSSTQQQYLKKINQSSDNLLLLINDILDLTKVEAGKLELEDIPFDLNEQLERLSGLFADLSEHKQLEVIIDKAPSVPNYLQGDPLRLGQILINLVNNAVKFTERGEVILKITVEEGAKPHLCFAVTDTGIGIIPDHLERLFHAFTQVDASTTRKYGGTGLGLSISHHLVQLMGGNIEVLSRPGLGSTFTVRLPLRVLESPPQPNSTAFLNKKVLLVDDNKLVLEIAKAQLHQLGMVVFTASSIEAAKDLLKKQSDSLDLAILDCCLAQDDGLELAKFIHHQASFAHIKLIIMSAFGQEKVSEKMHYLGLSHYLAKPITEPSLHSCIRRALDPIENVPTFATHIEQPQLADYRQQLMGKQILLAEDNRMNQQLIVEFLNQVGIMVTVVDNGRQAVELIARQPFDGILMDLQMPILDGIEATRQIRKLTNQHDIAIIALTASAMRGDREISLKAGMNSYVTKPVERFELYQALVQALLIPPLPPTRPLTGTTASNSESEVLLPQRLAFLAKYQDVYWQLMALMANKDWQGAHLLTDELSQAAQTLNLTEVVTQAQLLLVDFTQQRRADGTVLSSLKQHLANLAAHEQ